MVFVVEGLTTNILPTNEATLTAFTHSAISNHENIIHKMSTNILSPENYPLYNTVGISALHACMVFTES